MRAEVIKKTASQFSIQYILLELTESSLIFRVAVKEFVIKPLG